MKLENGYKLIYEVIENGVREFRASKTGVPADGDYVITSNTIGANKLVYEYEGKFYGTGAKFVPSYDENGIPTDDQLITDEAYAEVFVAKEPVEDEPGNEPDANSDEGSEEKGTDGGEEGDDIVAEDKE